MSISSIGGSGIPLPTPVPLYPASVAGVQFSTGNNKVSLPAGTYNLIPAGTWMVSPGQYSQVQILDPVSQLWMPSGTYGCGLPVYVNSDGVNYRVANLTGCPIGALVTNGGTGYTSAPAVTSNSGGAAWTAIVGGAVGAVTVGSNGAGYTYVPTVFISAPPTGGIQATASATLSGTNVQTIGIINAGAGYTSAPTVTVVANPMDPSTSITSARATTVVSGAQTVTAVVLYSNNGSPLGGVPSLTFAGGGGASAAATAISMLTVQAYTATNASQGYATPVMLTTTAQAAETYNNNPAISTQLFTPRPANVTAALSGAGLTATGQIVIDGGLAQQAPTALVLTSTPPAALATVALTMGGVTDTVIVTPL